MGMFGTRTHAAALPAAELRNRNIVRYGLMLIPPIAWVIAFAPLFLVSYGLRQNWAADALVPSLLEAAIVGLICIMVWQLYQKVRKP